MSVTSNIYPTIIETAAAKAIKLIEVRKQTVGQYFKRFETPVYNSENILSIFLSIFKI